MDSHAQPYDDARPQYTPGERLTGQIRNLKEGFGFISVPSVSRDFFFHKSDLRGVEFHELFEGQALSFMPSEDPRKPGRLRAVDARREAN